jgi:hypothetical protein
MSDEQIPHKVQGFRRIPRAMRPPPNALYFSYEALD